MAATGILRAADVIFYHPLDSGFVEHTVSEVWPGIASSVPGKIGQGESGVTSSTITTGPLSTLNAGGSDFINVPMNVAGLSATSVVGGYDNTDGKARAGIVSGSTITWGPEATFRTGARQNTGNERFTDNIRKLDSTHVVVGYTTSAPSGGHVKIGTISGLDLTWGPDRQFTTNILDGSLITVAMDSTHVLVMYRDGSVGPDQGFAKATVGLISGTDVTFGAETTFAAVVGHTTVFQLAAAVLSPTKVLAASATAQIFRVGTLVGTAMTWSVSTAHTTMTTSSRITLTALNSTTVVFVQMTGSTTGSTVRVVNVSGDDVTLGATVTASNTQRGMDAAKLTSNTCVLAWWSAGGGSALIGTVSGLTITLAPAIEWNSVNTLSVTVSAMTSTKFIIGGHDLGGAEPGTARSIIGTLAAEADISGTSGLYPTAIGHDRVVMAMWARNLTSGGSTVTVERSYSVAMTATSIALGGTTATWSGAGIDALMSIMNNDSDHLLVLDFENTGGTNWTLKTSVDGLAFTPQGTQTSGTQVVATTDTNPSLVIADGGGSTQWIDELVMWCGDKTTFASFETQEMANLFDLADTFGETMNQFEENFGAPLCWQATAKMPDGSVWRDSGNGPCPPVVRVPNGAEDVIVTDGGSKVSPRIIEG